MSKDWYDTLNEKMHHEEREAWNTLFIEIYLLSTRCRDYARCARMSNHYESRDRAILAAQELVSYVTRVPVLEGSSEGPHVCKCGGRCSSGGRGQNLENVGSA